MHAHTSDLNFRTVHANGLSGALPKFRGRQRLQKHRLDAAEGIGSPTGVHQYHKSDSIFSQTHFCGDTNVTAVVSDDGLPLKSIGTKSIPAQVQFRIMRTAHFRDRIFR